MRFAVYFLLCQLSVAFCQTAPANMNGESTSAVTKAMLVGAWRLVSIETMRPNGEVIYPFYGKHPEGLLV